MALDIIDHGQDNHVFIENPQHFSGQIIFHGNGNRVRLAPPVRGGRVHFTLRGNSQADIGLGLINGMLRLDVFTGGSFSLGEHCGINGTLSASVPEATDVRIGHGCLFAEGISMMSSDFHSIYDLTSRRRVNPARNIVIGPRVWIGSGVLVLKGSQIGHGAIIGARAVVAGKVPEFCAAAGNPLRVLRRNVTWAEPLRDEMPPGLDDPARFAETPSKPWPPPPPPAPVLLHALCGTWLKGSDVHSALLPDDDKIVAAPGARLVARRARRDGHYWRLDDALLDGAPLPTHINLAFVPHWAVE